MPSGAEINSSIPSNGTEQAENASNHTNEPTLNRSISHDPTSYVQRARTTRAAPPKPATNPLQFVQIKPCNLYQSAQAQLKRAEEVKKVKEVKKEEPEDWQSNLDSWKCGRRKRVEHIIDRVVEVKKLELEEHDKSRRKSKTFSEMLVDRESKGRKVSLPIYTEDDVNDLSDLGIGTSSASGKSSLSEDFDNHSVISDNQDAEKVSSDVENQSNPDNGNRDYISSPGYDTSSSTAPASSPDLCEYTYEGAIQDYKSRVSRTQTSNFNGYQTTASSSSSSATTNYPKELLTDRSVSLDFGKSLAENSLIKRPIMTKIENQLNRFAFKLDYGNDHEQTATESTEKITDQPNNVPSVNVLKRRELFEKETVILSTNEKIKLPNRVTDEIGTQPISIKERLSNLEKHVDETKEDVLITKLNRLTGDFNSVKEIRTNIENPIEMSTIVNDKVKIDVPVVPLKDRLTSFNLCGKTKESVNNDNDDEDDESDNEDGPIVTDVKEKSILQQPNRLEEIVKDCLPRNRIETTDRDDSGIHTTDVSSCVSQVDELLVDEYALNTSKPEYLSNGSTNNDENTVANDDTHDESESSMTDDCLSPPTILSPINESIVQTADEIVDQIADISADDKSTNEQDTSVIEALELAFKAIDVEPITTISLKSTNSKNEPIYENIDEISALYEELEHEEREQRKNAKNLGIVINTQATARNQIPESLSLSQSSDEPHYQVPKSMEPYYEVPKSKPIPLYENVEIFYPGTNTNNTNRFSIDNANNKEPPKEKPPPPPVENSTDDDDEHKNDDNVDDGNVKKNELTLLQDPMKRVNSTKRIKKEIRNKRTSFLGIDNSTSDDLEFSVAPPPDIAAIIQEERRLEKQLYNIKIGFDSSEPNTSSSENHSRQCSDLITSSEELEDDYVTLRKKNEDTTNNVYENLHHSASTNGINSQAILANNNQQQQLSEQLEKHRQQEIDRMRNLENQISEQEEVLRVERELLQLEEEELKRQQENLLLRESLARRELENGSKMLMSVANCQSLQNINAQCNSNHYVNVPTRRYKSNDHPFNSHRQSMPNLPDATNQFNYGIQKRLPPPIPPAKPMRLAQVAAAAKINRLQQQQQQQLQKQHSMPQCERLEIMHNRNHSAPIKNDTSHHQHQQSSNDFIQLRTSQPIASSSNHHSYGNMSRHTLHALSAAPKPKLQDEWVQQQSSQLRNNKNDYVNVMPLISDNNCIRGKFENTKDFITNESWNNNNSAAAMNHKRKSEPQNFNYNKHWLIQEAEQLRIDQQHGIRSSSNGWIQRKGSGDNKPLPDAIIQTLTQRVQNRLPDRKRVDNFETKRNSEPINTNGPTTENQKEILSVSGKKKCSYCEDELGRGAAMIIESLQLFYHLDCFKCCVCRIQLGDGVSGADVRVRNKKLHCHNCFSSDDGIKFSCV